MTAGMMADAENRSLHEDVVRVLTAWPAPDEGQHRLREEFLAHLAAHQNGVWRECLAGHITASTALLDATGTRVLLTLHAKVKAWLQLGGHCEPADSSLAAVALREAREESGIEGLTLLPGPVRLDRHAVTCQGGSHHLDVQYAAVAPDGAREQVSAESDELRWFAVDALPAGADGVLRRLVAHATSVRAALEVPGGPERAVASESGQPVGDQAAERR